MAPEYIARRCIHVAKGGISFAGIDERVLIPNIVEAIRSAERSAYERAALCADPHEDDDAMDRQVKRQVAQAIRDLAKAEAFAT